MINWRPKKQINLPLTPVINAWIQYDIDNAVSYQDNVNLLHVFFKESESANQVRRDAYKKACKLLYYRITGFCFFELNMNEFVNNPHKN